MKKIQRFLKLIYQHRLVLSILAFILFAFLANTFHTQFPDEFDNIFGGFLINHGKLPYVGFFTHHNPGAYYLASVITFFTRRSFVAFRIVFSLVLFIFFITSYKLLKRRLKLQQLHFFLLYGILVAVGATYWWGQMLLSETVVGFLLVPAFLLVMGKRLYKVKFDTIDLWLVSLLLFFSLFVSLTYIYFIPMFYLVVLYLYFLDNKPKKFKNFTKPIFIFAIPYIVFFIYLLITKSLYEFYFASIFYNVTYYIYNFPKVAGIVSSNPVRYAVHLANHNINNFFALLTQVNSFNFSYPLNISLALGNIVLLVYLIMKKEVALVILVISMMFYTNARSEPLGIKETDFHATVYIMLTISTVSFLFFQLKKELNTKLPYFSKMILTSFFLLTSIYWFFTSFFLFNNFCSKVYGKIMGRDPLIYDRPQVAKTLNKILEGDDYYWIGPFELQELLFIKGKIASKYFWFLPANSRDEKIKSEIISDLTKNRPKVIIFKKWWANFGVKPEDFNTVIVEFLDNNYFQLKDIEQGKYKSKVAKERDFDFENEYFFDINRKEEIIQQLLEKGLIQ